MTLSCCYLPTFDVIAPTKGCLITFSLLPEQLPVGEQDKAALNLHVSNEANSTMFGVKVSFGEMSK